MGSSTNCAYVGVLKQFGDVGVAFALVTNAHHRGFLRSHCCYRSLAIALHTFFALVFRWRPKPSSKLPLLVVAGIWITIALIIGISFATHRHKIYYGDTQYCEYYRLSYFCTMLISFHRVLDYFRLSSPAHSSGISLDVDHCPPKLCSLHPHRPCDNM